MDWTELISGCARDRGNALLWSEFLRRYGPKIRQFIRGAWRLSLGEMASTADVSAVLGGMQESDLFQDAVVRLVENDCAAMKRFSGTGEEHWLAYLAVIARSVTRDSLRRRRAMKRSALADAVPWHAAPTSMELNAAGTRALERGVLGRELKDLGQRTIGDMGGECSSRDKLIFKLYFDHDLSAHQISQCRGVNLSKAGVEKVIHRLTDLIRKTLSTETPEEIAR